MKNKTMGIIYFICFAILSGIILPANSLAEYQVTAEINNTQYTQTSEIEKLFRLKLEEFNEFINYIKVPRGLLLSIDNSIFFSTNSNQIKESSKKLLDRIGQLIKFLEKPCVIEGNVKVSDNKNYDNWEISTAQSQKIAEYLITNHDISPQNIRALGFGSKIPSDLDNRIDFVIFNYDK